MIFLLGRMPPHKCAQAKMDLNRSFLKTMSEKFTHQGWGMRAKKAFDPPIKFYIIDK
jgi:hypothetical protein